MASGAAGCPVRIRRSPDATGSEPLSTPADRTGRIVARGDGAWAGRPDRVRGYPATRTRSGHAGAYERNASAQPGVVSDDKR